MTNVISLDSVSDEAEDFELSAELISPKPENLAYDLYLRLHRKPKVL